MNNDYWELVERRVPERGSADTVQGELVRAVLRLTAECYRNECGNWDRFFETLVDFACDKFSDGTLDSHLFEQAYGVLERLREYGRAADEVPEWVYDQLCRDLDAPLEKAAVQWCARHPALISFGPRDG